MRMTNRSRLIGIIHMQRHALGLSEDEYRQILLSSVQKKSCSECSYSELKEIFNELNKIIKSIGRKPFFFKPYSSSLYGSSMQNAVIARSKKIFKENWQKRLDGFLEKINKTSLVYCNPKELRQIMGILSRIESKSRVK